MREEETRFELNMLVNNPAMYQEYMKNKQEDEASGNAGIEWRAPETRNEAMELMQAFAEIDKQIKEQSSSEEKEADINFINQVSMMNEFNNINIDEMGD